MKSLLITFDFPPIVSGISTVFYYIWKYIPHNQYIILAPRVAGVQEMDVSLEKKIYRWYFPLGNQIGKKIIRGILLFFYTLIIVYKEKITLLQCGQPMIIGAIGLLCKKFFRIRYYVWVYGGEVVKFKQSRCLLAILRQVLHNADKIIVNSSFSRQTYINFGVSAHKIVVITPGVDTVRFTPSIKDRKLVCRYNLDNKKVILTVARLTERKGHDRVIEALRIIKKQFPAIVYLVVGAGQDQKRLEQIVRAYHLTESVIFTGFVAEADLPLYYNLCDIYVMPNREVQGIDTLEGFGISFIEASACAKPVIGGTSGGSCDAVRHGMTGMLIDPEDTQLLADTLICLLSDATYAQQLGSHGREWVCERFQWIDRSNVIIQTIQDTMSQYAGTGRIDS